MTLPGVETNVSPHRSGVRFRRHKTAGQETTVGNVKAGSRKGGDPLAKEIEAMVERHQASFGPAQKKAYDRMMTMLTGDKPARPAKADPSMPSGRKLVK